MSVRSLVVLSVLFAVAEGGCDCTITWNVQQMAGGTCPGGFAGPGGEAYDWMIQQIFSGRRRLAWNSCNPAAGTSATPNCVVGGGGSHSRRRLGDDCDQCSSADDDDDDLSYGYDDDRRRLSDVMVAATDEWGNLASVLSYSITADVPNGEDPLTIMNDVEAELEEFFKDEENARVTWITKARELGSDMSEDTDMKFYTPEADEDSVEVAQREESSDKSSRLGLWIGLGVAGVAALLAGTYGVKAYHLKHGANVSEQTQAEPSSVEIVSNPLSSGAQQNSPSAEGREL